ncbi:hypothetical protein K0M31_018191 [Melipona bicolor]|uniref:Uncharacterized protein n=1 Tax=Melipona bicolor TaxID=60889 RepID=A0AA40KE11_9HYME|nr:hypothetical protein K0M31_018191 [Melipona bicolor]
MNGSTMGFAGFLDIIAGQLGGGLHGVSVLDGHVVGNSPPSGRRSTKSRSLPRGGKLTLSYPPFLARPRDTTEFTSEPCLSV